MIKTMDDVSMAECHKVVADYMLVMVTSNQSDKWKKDKLSRIWANLIYDRGAIETKYMSYEMSKLFNTETFTPHLLNRLSVKDHVIERQEGLILFILGRCTVDDCCRVVRVTKEQNNNRNDKGTSAIGDILYEYETKTGAGGGTRLTGKEVPISYIYKWMSRADSL